MPSTTTPSVAIFSPGRTTKRSPTRELARSARAARRRRRRAPRRPSRRARAARAARRRRGAWRAPRSSGRRGGTPSRPTRPRGRSVAARPRSGRARRHRHRRHAGVAEEQRVRPTSRTRRACRRETSVSIVAAPWRRFVHAARWNGHAPQITTGVASASDEPLPVRRTAAPGPSPAAATGTREHGGDDQPPAQRAPSGRRSVGAAAVGAGRRGAVAGRLDGRDQLARASTALGSYSTVGLLGGVVDRRGDAVELVELALDPGRARRAGHARRSAARPRRRSCCPTIPPGGILRRWPPPLSKPVSRLRARTRTSCSSGSPASRARCAGIARMIEDDRYCIDILTQLGAVDTALEAVALKVLDEHVQHCVAGALASGDAKRGEREEPRAARSGSALRKDALAPRASLAGTCPDAKRRYGSAVAEEHTLEVDGRELVDHAARTRCSSPSAARRSSTSSSYYLAVGEPLLRAMGGRPVLLQRFPRRRRAASRSSRSACPTSAPDVAADDRSSARRTARRRDALVARRPRPRPLGREPRLPRLPRVAVPGRRPRASPTSCASTSTRSRASTFDEVREAAARGAGAARRARHRRLPEDHRATAASTSTCGSSRAGTRYEVRAAAVAVARELERRRPDLITAAWWKEERGERVFVDFNQNAPHKTVFGAWSVRPRAGAQVSTPFALGRARRRSTPTSSPSRPCPARVADARRPVGGHGRRARSRSSRCSSCHERDRGRRACMDAPWPPVYPKMPDEPPRVAPSRARKQS